MGRPTLPTLPIPYPLISFSRLRHLVISSPWTVLEADTMWQFILGFANTLETLEIEEINSQDPIQLGKLTSLRHLKTISSVTDADGNIDIDRKLRAICRLLSTAAVASPPVGMESITIQFDVQVLPGSNFSHAASLPGWLELDDILTGSSFPNLRRVEFDFHFFIVGIFTSTSWALSGSSWRPPSLSESRLSMHPFIDFKVNAKNIRGPHPMAVYLYFL
ncbi:hypothetical protein M413DRAFT_123971 [Hebeloma cylindrosporum]|uniref:Uncharacterized protein n=1 Tax=Hebeloma cylindrosporum TaxID=76867 RepID=A0A0C3CF24_HEBCY|nr:hypothetical protein M413DRAFT_123971 [Hebeloma cylindrosporum h7]